MAALEAMLAFDVIAYSKADVHLFSPSSTFVLKPLAVSSGFGRGELLRYDLSKLTETAGATFHHLGVSGIDAEQRLAKLSDDSEFSYDYLIASPGAEPVWSVPGATSYPGPAGTEALKEALAPLRDRDAAKIVVAVPEGGAWPLPAYELALLIADELGSSASMTIVTPESSPLDLFGKSSTEKVAELLRSRKIETVLETAPKEYRDGALSTTDGRQIEADLVLAMPLLTGRRIPGLPYDEQGFIPVDDFGQILELDREFAAGDVTSFPVKFGGLATEQADVVAAAIAAAAWKTTAPKPFKPVYHGTLVTPEGPVGLGPGVGSSDAYAWDPAEKVHGRYLTPFLKAADPATLGTHK